MPRHLGRSHLTRGSRPTQKLNGFTIRYHGCDKAKNTTGRHFCRWRCGRRVGANMADPFASPRDVALALLTCNSPGLSKQAGSFLAQLAVDPSPISQKQANWLEKWLDRAGLPSLEGGQA